jgi:hypothetical protein
MKVVSAGPKHQRFGVSDTEPASAVKGRDTMKAAPPMAVITHRSGRAMSRSPVMAKAPGLSSTDPCAQPSGADNSGHGNSATLRCAFRQP